MRCLGFMVFLCFCENIPRISNENLPLLADTKGRLIRTGCDSDANYSEQL